MLSTTLGFVTHILVSSYRIITPIGQLIQFVLPYATMANKAISRKINYNTKHLSKGDPYPPYNGKLRIYNMRYCPFAHRTILALTAKDIDFEVVNINLVNKPEWFNNKTPFGVVPVLEVAEGVCLYESSIIVEYLDEVYTQKPLMPTDPLRKAQDKIIIQHNTASITLFEKLLKSPDSVNEEVMSNFHNALGYIDKQLKTRGTKFLSGEEPGYVDYMIWPWFEKLKIFVTVDERAKIDSEKYAELTEYMDRMSQDRTVSAYKVVKEVLFKVLNGYRPGNVPNYDLLLESE